MSLKDSTKKLKQNNLPNYPNIHDIQKQINFIKKNNNNKKVFNANNFIQSKFNYNKMIQNKNSSQPIHENRSSSVSNLLQKNDDKKRLIFFPINLKVPSINQNWKNMEREKNKSMIDIIKIPKNNINNNENKAKENNNINYIFNTYNLSSKNPSYKLIKKKTKETINKETAIGRICAEVIAECPPGISILLPGELITEAHMPYLTDYETIEVVK